MSSKENITDMMALSKADGQIGWERYVHLWALRRASHRGEFQAERSRMSRIFSESGVVISSKEGVCMKTWGRGGGEQTGD